MNGGPLQNLQLSNTPKATSIWNICRQGLEFFTKHLFWIPGNDNKKNLWDDKIKGYDPLNYDPTIVDIKCWLVSNCYL